MSNYLRPRRRGSIKEDHKEAVRFINHMKKWYETSFFDLPAWIKFAELCISEGYKIYIKSAKRTKSKYIYVSNFQKTVKIRFSDHTEPNWSREQQDCDFYVGKTINGYRHYKHVFKSIQLIFNTVKLS